MQINILVLAIIDISMKTMQPELNLPSPTHAVEIQSIFTGLKLSAEVASNEGGQSPYMQRVTTEGVFGWFCILYVEHIVIKWY